MKDRLQNQDERAQLGAFHRLFSRYFLTMYARERERHPGKSEQYLREAAIYQAVLLMNTPLMGVAVLFGSVFLNTRVMTFFGMSPQASIALLMFVGAVSIFCLRLAVVRIVSDRAYSSENACLFEEPRDQSIATLVFWGAFVISLGLPALAIVAFNAITRGANG